jgi:hypothetical protein
VPFRQGCDHHLQKKGKKKRCDLSEEDILLQLSKKTE